MASPSASSVTSFHTAAEVSPPPGRIASSGQVDAKEPTEKDDDAKDVKDVGHAEDMQDAEDATDTKDTKDTKSLNEKASSENNTPSFRAVQRLPHELRDHIRVFLEERMYIEAIRLLTSLLAAGGSSAASATGQSPLWVPPPSHLAVLATLAVHPAYTTRPQDGNDLRVAGHALQYLRHILTVAGPVQAELASAFQFRDAQGRLVGGQYGSRRDSGRDSRRNSGRNSGRNSLNAMVASAPASAAGSRSNSARPRRRVGTGRFSRNGASSEYVDSSNINFGDDDDYGGGFDAFGDRKADALANAVHAAADDIAMGGGGGGDDDDDIDMDDEAIGGRMATRDSVWMRGQDFWRVVAWAFACSVREPARWRCWQPWLTLVVDVLEADLGERLAASRRKGGAVQPEDLYQSLLFQYLDGGNGGSNNSQLRRIVMAILADGSQSASLVREVFDKETVLAGPAAAAVATQQHQQQQEQLGHHHLQHSPFKPVRKLDLTNNKFGDYSDDDESAPPTPESSPSPSPTPAGRAGKPAKKAAPSARKISSGSHTGIDPTISPGSSPGFLDSLPLRRRLLYLATLGSVYFPAEFAAPDAVNRATAEVLRESDISVFAAFISAPSPASTLATGHAAVALAPPVPALAAPDAPTPDDMFVELLRHILFTYLPASAPKPYLVDSAASALPSPIAAISARVLERCFLPFAANTVLLGANVRMALSLESLFRLVWGAAGTGNIWTPALQAAAEAGVQAREARVRSAASTNNNNSSSSISINGLGRDLLQRSGRRLLAMVQLAKLDAEGR